MMRNKINWNDLTKFTRWRIFGASKVALNSRDWPLNQRRMRPVKATS